MLDHFRSENMKESCNQSEEYQQLVRAEEESYARLDELDLTKEQRQAVEEAYEAQSAADAEYALASYFCGITDCLRFLKYIEERDEH